MKIKNKKLDRYLDHLIENRLSNARTIEFEEKVFGPSWNEIVPWLAVAGVSFVAASAFPAIVPSIPLVAGTGLLGGLISAIPGGLVGGTIGGIGIAVFGTAFGIPALAVTSALAALSAVPGAALAAIFAASATTTIAPAAIALNGIGFSALAYSGLLVLIKLWQKVKSDYKDVVDFLSDCNETIPQNSEMLLIKC